MPQQDPIPQPIEEVVEAISEPEVEQPVPESAEVIEEPLETVSPPEPKEVDEPVQVATEAFTVQPADEVESTTKAAEDEQPPLSPAQNLEEADRLVEEVKLKRKKDEI